MPEEITDSLVDGDKPTKIQELGDIAITESEIIFKQNLIKYAESNNGMVNPLAFGIAYRISTGYALGRFLELIKENVADISKEAAEYLQIDKRKFN